MSTTEQQTGVPTGTWRHDPVHSSISFAVQHNTVMTFQGQFGEWEASLADGRLTGSASVSSAWRRDAGLRVLRRRRLRGIDLGADLRRVGFRQQALQRVFHEGRITQQEIPVDECVAQLKEHLAVGVQKIIFVPYKYRMDQVEMIAKEIIPRLKA